MRLVAVAGAAVLGACGSDPAPAPHPPVGFDFAYALPDCAPWDGRAVRIVLTSVATDDPESARPQLRAVIYPRETELTGKTYRWPASPDEATGARCDAESCDEARAGEVRVTAERPDSVLEGTVILQFANAETVSGSFRAFWRPRAVFCG
jgi:hypothetical protein